MPVGWSGHSLRCALRLVPQSRIVRTRENGASCMTSSRPSRRVSAIDASAANIEAGAASAGDGQSSDDARHDDGRSADLHQLGAMGKAFSILEIIAESNEPLTMAEIVRASGLTKPTAHRITTLLSEMGFIERDLLRRGYVGGPRLVRLSHNALRSAAPRSVRRTLLRTVAETTGETCNFCIIDGAEVIYLDRVEAKWPLGLRLETGSRVPAHCTATGKLLLSLLPARDRAQMLMAMPLPRYTQRTITDPSKLNEALEAILHSEVGTDAGEYMEGVVCVSVPVMLGNGDVLGALTVSAPEARISLEQAMTFVPTLRDAADRIAMTFQPASAGQ